MDVPVVTVQNCITFEKWNFERHGGGTMQIYVCQIKFSKLFSKHIILLFCFICELQMSRVVHPFR